MPKPAEASLRETLDSDTNRLISTAEGDNSAQAIKAARTRWENSHKAYWREVRKAWRDVQQGKKGSAQEIADRYGVELSDIAEIAGTEDPDVPTE